nr:MAG TPA: hypothetical protein [Caudoviricetes sp.]DAX31478.1 MAG TPA: hypothetical protein [Caudoviricetes sp.]
MMNLVPWCRRVSLRKRNRKSLMSLPRLTNENLRKDLIQTNYCEISIREGAFFIAFFREGGGIVSYKQRHSYLMKKLYIFRYLL